MVTDIKPAHELSRDLRPAVSHISLKCPGPCHVSSTKFFNLHQSAFRTAARLALPRANASRRSTATIFDATERYDQTQSCLAEHFASKNSGCPSTAGK